MSNINLEACLKLIADRRRRLLIHLLRQHDNRQTTIDDLVDRMSRWEQDDRADRSPDRDQLAIQAYHTHIPMLADYGVVKFDPDGGAVQYLGHERVEDVMDSVPEDVPRPKL